MAIRLAKRVEIESRMLLVNFQKSLFKGFENSPLSVKVRT
jgi:hypothetical protein